MTEYVDFAEYYDYDHAIDFDIAFYLEAATQCQSPILELACGTGRLLIPLARAGFEMYGLDVSPNMLDICRRAVERHHLAERVHLCLANMVSFELPRKGFPLAFIALRSFMHLLTRADQLACLQRVHEHLRPGGQFVLTAIAPDPVKLAREPGECFTVRAEFGLPNGHHVIRRERLVAHDVANQLRQFEFKFEEFDAVGRLVRERLVPLWARYLFVDELQGLLERAGFQLLDLFRNYDRKPYNGTGEMIVVARRPS